MDFKICDNNCTNNAIEELEHLRSLLREVVACSVYQGNGEAFCKLEQDTVELIKEAVC